MLLWYSRHYMQMQFLFGLPPSLSTGQETLPLFLQMYQHPSYHADATILFGTQVENTDLFPQQATLTQQWDSSTHIRTLSTRDFTRRCRTSRSNSAATFPPSAETVVRIGKMASRPTLTPRRWSVRMKRARLQRKNSPRLTSLVNPKYAADTSSLRRMWTNMILADEHTWDSYNSVSDPTSKEAVDQLALKELYPVKAAALADFITRNSMASIANSISAGSGNAIVV